MTKPKRGNWWPMIFVTVFVFTVLAVANPVIQNKDELTALTLSPAASKEFIEVQKQKAELERQYREAHLREQLILADAGIPKAERDRKWAITAAGVVMLLPKEVPSLSPSPLTSASPKVDQ